MDRLIQYTDHKLIQKILNGEIKLFEILIRRNNIFLYKVGRSYNYNHEDTEDLMQDTFIKAYTNLNRFENRSSFKTWLIKIMINNCYHRQQKFSYKNEKANALHENDIPMFSNSGIDTNKTIMSRELGMIIEDALYHLPEDYRIVFALRKLDGLSVIETAEALNISEANVKVRLNRAKSMLRKEIEKSYSPTEIFEFNLVYCDKMVEKVMMIIN